jgi:DNA polymerase-3 subunit delta
MEYMQLFKSIRSEKPGKLYLFHGPEEFTKEQALSQLTDRLVPPKFRDLNYQMIDGTETSADAIIAACETLPFLSDRRLIVVKDYVGLGGQKSGDEETLKKYLDRIADDTCLVFYHRGAADKTRKIYKAIKKNGETVEFVRLKNPELSRWTAKTFRKYGKEISGRELNYFLTQVGNNLEDISNEIRKLASYTGSSDCITMEEIDKLVTPSPEYTVFQLVDAISSRQRAKALKLLEVLLDSGQSVFGLISLIARQIKIMLLCKDYTEKGYSLRAVQKELRANPFKLHPYSVKKGMDQSQNFTMVQLRRDLDICLEADYGIKNGRVKERLGVEMLVIKMCVSE